ncbi:MAG: Mov34/MPN/PAD-1 family protein [Candidatus Diapherotrites archaeon]|nr:Mov34/MPN/PAD-1 family protein [Candidatus Diapherotrites archaeon]
MKIKKETLDFIVEACRNTYPNEFIGLLRAKNNVITEVLVIPGSTFEQSRSTLKEYMVPLDPTIVGSIHSHPGPPIPSKADLNFFARHGKIHIIVGINEIRAFDRHGNQVPLEIIK